jgi:hypothetical protein
MRGDNKVVYFTIQQACMHVISVVDNKQTFNGTVIIQNERVRGCTPKNIRLNFSLNLIQIEH